jgi:hypothetical protein
MKRIFVLFAIGLASTALAALPPLFDSKPRALAPARTVCEFPVGTFLENVIALPDGTLLVDSYLEGIIYRVEPASGRHTVFAKIPGTIAGIADADGGAFIVSGWIGGKQPGIFHVAADGTVETLVTLPDGQFPNGVVRLAGSHYLVADSYRGVIWEVDAVAKTARIWFEHATLARPDPKNALPAVNGLKIHDGTLYYSNTQALTLHKLALTPEGRPAGEPQLVAAQVNLDDFAIGEDGALYGTTHVFNVVVRVSLADGGVTVVAEPVAGVVGCTAAVFGGTARDRDTLYVVGNGGMSMPLPGGVQSAKVVALKFDAKP